MYLSDFSPLYSFPVRNLECCLLYTTVMDILSVTHTIYKKQQHSGNVVYVLGFLPVYSFSTNSIRKWSLEAIWGWGKWMLEIIFFLKMELVHGVRAQYLWNNNSFVPCSWDLTMKSETDSDFWKELSWASFKSLLPYNNHTEGYFGCIVALIKHICSSQLCF